MIAKAAARAALLAATALAAAPALASEPAAPGATIASAPLEEQFRDPPAEARPRVWWHWMNGNVSKDGIAEDLAWMKRVGIGGMQNFDANQATPQIVDNRLVYMTPEWKDAFAFTAREADRLGLELAIASSPGWSITGGPWVPPADAMKKLVWTETEIVGGRRFTGTLPRPCDATGPWQCLPKSGSISQLMGGKQKDLPRAYGDARAIAWPVAAASALPLPRFSDALGKPLDAAPLADADPASFVTINPVDGAAPMLVMDYGKPQTVRSARLFVPGGWMLFARGLVAPRLEAEVDGQWRHVADIESGPTPTTVSFAPVTAQRFRAVFPVRTDGFNAFQFDAAEGTDPGGAMSLSALSAMSGKQRPAKVGDLRLMAEERIDRAETKAAFEIAPDYYALATNAPEARGIDPAKVIDLTDRLRPDGSLDWTPPAGRWKVVRLGWSLVGTMNHPATEEATGLEVDKFDGAAVGRYLDHYLGMYRDASGNMIGQRGVRALLTDSIEVGASNWTPAMVDRFKALRGYDPVPWFPALTGAIVGSRAQSDRFLYDYRRTLADLMASVHYGTIAKVARRSDLVVYGEALENGRPSLGDDMAMRAHADVPMSAMWTHRRETGPRWAHVADIKGAASVANIYGRRFVATEALTSAASYWSHGPAYLKRIADLAYVSGMNRPVIHTSVHQPVDDKVPGLSLGMFGQYFGRHESWGEMARPWMDYLSRTSLMLQQGRNVADVAYFFGEEAPLTALYADKPVPDAPKEHTWDFLNPDALIEALANEGNELVTPGGARYRAIQLAGTSQSMTLPALRKLAALVEGGATVVGLPPKTTPSLADDRAEWSALVAKLWPGTDRAQVGKGQVYAMANIDAALAAMGVAPGMRVTGAGEGARIPYVHRTMADGDSFFLVNQLDRTEAIEARFRVTGKLPELWSAETGKAHPVSYRAADGETIVPLTLHADDSVHVVFRKPATAPSLTVTPRAPAAAGDLSGPWTVAFQPGRGAPASITLDSLVSLDQHADPGVKYFSGEATYAREFRTPKGWKPGQQLWLNLGLVREVAEVRVNGQHAGWAWRAPWRVDLSNVAKKGRNRLEIKVANLWVNRLIGDRQPGALKVTWTAMPTYLPDAPLKSSGLIGPVKLETAR